MLKPEIVSLLAQNGLSISRIHFNIQSMEVCVMLEKLEGSRLAGRVELPCGGGDPSTVNNALESAFKKCLKQLKLKEGSYYIASVADGL